jgi:hypothetical protein
VLGLGDVVVREVEDAHDYEDEADDHGDETVLIVFELGHLSVL